MTTTQGQAWTKENLTAALNTAIAVELFTIPVYISAASSIRESDRSTACVPTTLPGPTKGTTITQLFSPHDIIMSVAVQEMFHLTMICNVANALGVRPVITAPDLDNPPSCLTGIAGMPVRGNLNTLIDTMLAIEAPDPNYNYDEDPTNPVSPTGPKLYHESYDSIGDLYHALAYGVQAMWETMYSQTNDAYAKLNFKAKYPDVKPVIQTLQDAWNAMACITEQGEGTGSNGFMPEAYIPAIGQQYQVEDEISHWQRFKDISDYISGGNTIPQYQEQLGSPTSTAPDQLKETYSLVIQQMALDFSTPNTTLNLRGMAATGSIATAIWQAGLVPQWDYMADPTPWPPIPPGSHVCQGLNMCQGQGYDQSGTMPGDGDCATSGQGCYTTNVCKGLGACGYVPTGVTPIPGQNDCSGQGGCQSPISPCQVYSSTTATYAGQFVWHVARELFKNRLIKDNKLAPDGELPAITKVMPRRYNPELSPTNGMNGSSCPLPSTEG